MNSKPVKVLMVCLGNICRSPTAEGVFRATVEKANLQHAIQVDSVGTSDWHVGEAPDSRSIKAAAKQGYDISLQRGRQVQDADFNDFDYIVAMDQQNLRDLQQRCPPALQHKLSLFLQHGTSIYQEVPDPYNSGNAAFELVLELAEDASTGLLQKLLVQHSLSR